MGSLGTQGAEPDLSSSKTMGISLYEAKFDTLFDFPGPTTDVMDQMFVYINRLIIIKIFKSEAPLSYSVYQ